MARLLLGVSDTLPRGLGGWGQGLFQWFLEGMPPPPLGRVWHKALVVGYPPPPGGGGVGFSSVLGLRALRLRGIENFNMVFTQRGAHCTGFVS